MSRQVNKEAVLAVAVSLFSQAAVLAEEQNHNEPDSLRPRIGLALGGGGARGAAHIGVLRIFEQEHIPIDFITGTSVGSVVGGLYAAGVSLDQIQKLVENKSLVHAYNRTPVSCSVAYVPLTLVPRLFGLNHFVGLYKGDKFADFLEHMLPPQRTNIENTVIPFEAVATDLLSGQTFVIDHGPLGKALQASTAIPWLKQPVRFGDKLLCDGFLSGSNLPVAQSREMGADIVVCVDIDGSPETVSSMKLRHIGSFHHRTTNIVLAAMDESAANRADLLLRPDVNDLGILSTKRSNLRKGIIAGENAAREAIPQIRRLARLDNFQNTIYSTASGTKLMTPSLKD